jgi:glycosyltransferase involved in cell wall biosynthesis
MVEKNNPKALAEKILWIRSLPSDKRQAMALNLREEVVRNHNLDTLVRTIINQFRNESKAA